jgi:hypothetical protein
MGNLGSAVHLALYMKLCGEPVLLDSIAKQYDVGLDELERLYAYGCSAWWHIKRYFPSPKLEAKVKGRGIAGHVDVMQIGDDIVILDWKSNRVKRDYTAQLTGYAAAAVEEYGMPESGRVTVVTVWLRFGEYDIRELSQEDIDRLYAKIDEARKDIGKRYAPGDACAFCRRQLVCEARHQYLASASATLMPLGSVELRPDLLPRLYQQAKMLRKALDAYDKALKMHLKECGSAENGAGLLLELVETRRERIIPQEAWPCLVDAGLSEHELAYCMTMSKTKIMEIVGSKQKRGEKGKVRAALMEELRANNAVVSIPSEDVRARKVES